MKFISLQENLKKALSIITQTNTKSINLPILNNVLIKAYNNELELISTNLEIGIIHKIRSKVEREGEFTVNAKIIHDYINLLPGEKVKIEEKSDELVVECENYKTKIKGESAKEFPLIPLIEKNKSCVLLISDFKDALSQVSFAASSGDNRPELSGVLFNFNEENLILAATDSYRLAEKKVNFIKNNFNEEKIIIPIKTIQELLRILNNISIDDKEKINIYLSDNQVLFQINSIELISRLITGHYPDYQQIIPEKHSTIIEINKQEISRAIKAAALFSKTGINDISLIFKNNQIIVSASSGQSGESNIILNSKQTGIDNDVIINYRYLLDGLNNLFSENIMFNLINSQTPCLIQEKDDDQYVYIVMPIRQ